MSTLVSLPKNDTVSGPSLNSWIDEWLGKDIIFRSNTKINTGITLPAL
ncbi:hypothetical protein [Maribacter aestuarii]|nr:hypothetical protein [Maribacter aestuarii]